MEHPWGTWASQLLKTSKEIFSMKRLGIRVVKKRYELVVVCKNMQNLATSEMQTSECP